MKQNQKEQRKSRPIASSHLPPTEKQIDFLLALGLPQEHLAYIDSRRTASDVIRELLATE